MRRTYRWDKNTRKMVEIRRDLCETPARMQIAPDIDPYKSMITGEAITSRSQHREHLRRHGCEEMGNEKPAMVNRPMPGPSEADVRDSIREAKRQVEWGEAPTLERLRDESPAWRRDMGLE